MITKLEFTAAIEALEEQGEYDLHVAEHLSVVFPNAFEPNLLYDNNTIREAFTTLLATIFDDTDKWIEYYIYELEFGAKYEPGCAKDANGDDIDVSSPAALYDVLTADEKIESYKEKTR